MNVNATAKKRRRLTLKTRTKIRIVQYFHTYIKSYYGVKYVNLKISSFIRYKCIVFQRSLSQDDAIYKKRCEKVYTFIRIPGKIESLMFYGLLCCLDIFVSLFTFIPLRCCLTLLKTVTWPIWRPFLGPKRFIFQSQVMDIARVVLILITCLSPWSPIVSVNTSGLEENKSRLIYSYFYSDLSYDSWPGIIEIIHNFQHARSRG